MARGYSNSVVLVVCVCVCVIVGVFSLIRFTHPPQFPPFYPATHFYTRTWQKELLRQNLLLESTQYMYIRVTFLAVPTTDEGEE